MAAGWCCDGGTPNETKIAVVPSYDKDVELARRCEAGDERAWEQFVLEYRPILYRAADALDPSGGAREIADALYAELYGLREQDGERRSLFRYFHGRSSLATWLRAVLAQRLVDRHRAETRFEPLPDQDLRAAQVDPPDPDAERLLGLVRRALDRAVTRLSDRDRLRLAWYYVHDLTLAQIGRALREHEATASRHLTRVRGALRREVERSLAEEGLTAAQISRGLELAAGDPGTLDLTESLGPVGDRKNIPPDRSI
jgi:RNA polymerase sigma factor (sigma-70 family)